LLRNQERGGGKKRRDHLGQSTRRRAARFTPLPTS
jgi:hypothetical protein